MKTSILCLLLALAAPCAMSQPRPNLARAAAEAAASAAAPVEAGVERAEAEAWRIARAGVFRAPRNSPITKQIKTFLTFIILRVNISPCAPRPENSPAFSTIARN